MKKKIIPILALVLALGIGGSLLASCNGNNPETSKPPVTTQAPTTPQPTTTPPTTTPQPTTEPEKPDAEPMTENALFAMTGGYCKLDLNKDGTYSFLYPSMGVKESGSWTWKGWTLTLTSAKGREMTATQDEAHTLILNYVADVNEQLKDTFTAKSSVWGAAFKGTGDYTPVGGGEEKPDPEPQPAPVDGTVYSGKMPGGTEYKLIADGDVIKIDGAYSASGHYVICGDALLLTDCTDGMAAVWSRVPKLTTIGEGNALTLGATISGEMSGQTLSMALSNEGTAEISVMNMTIKCSYTLNGANILLADKTEGNDQIWSRISKLWNVTADGAKTGMIVTIKVKEIPVTISLASDKTASISAMGMTVKCAYAFENGVLTLSDKTEGNDQVWAGLPKTINVTDGIGSPVES